MIHPISKNQFIFFDRSWSHIHDFGDVIKRIFIIFRCPSFPTLTKNEVQICKKICFKDVPVYFLIFREVFWCNLLCLHRCALALFAEFDLHRLPGHPTSAFWIPPRPYGLPPLVFGLLTRHWFAHSSFVVVVQYWYGHFSK